MGLNLDPIKLYHLNVNIVEAKQLSVTSDSTLVEVSINKKIKIARAVTRHTNNPYFNKFLQFSFQESLNSLLKYKLRIALYHTTCHKLIGFCDIELGTVWNQPGQRFIQKWASLSDPKSPLAGFTGYIKCDIELIEEGSERTMLQSDLNENNEPENNLLMPFLSNFTRKKGIFSIDIYHADGINCWKRKKYGKASRVLCKNMYVKVEFAGKTIQTRVIKNTDKPSWNESLNFVDAIPSLFQTIQIELWDNVNNLLVGEASLSLHNLWNQTQAGFLPSFGPSFVYLNKATRKPHVTEMTGRVMIAVSSELIDPNNPGKLIESFPISPLHPCPFPHISFSLHFILFQCTAFLKKYMDGFELVLGHGTFKCPDDPSKDMIDFGEERRIIRLNQPATVNKHCSYWAFSSDELPSATISRQWCDRRDRDLCYNFIGLQTQLITSQIMECRRLSDIGEPLQATVNCKEMLKNLKSTCQTLLTCPPFDFQTNLDIARRVEFVENVESACKEIDSIVIMEGMNCDAVLEFAEQWLEEIMDYTKDPQPRFANFDINIRRATDGNPKSQLWLKTEDYLYDKRIEKRGSKCGKLETLLFRDSAGDEIIAVEGLIWFGRNSILEEWCNYTIKVPESGLLELRVHVYQGRLNPGCDASGLADPFLRVHSFGQVRETSVKAQTLDPLWDETLVFAPVPFFAHPEFIIEQSIGVVFELFDYDGANKFEIVGRGVFRPKVTLKYDAYIPPKLERVTVYSFGSDVAEVVLTMELLEVPSGTAIDTSILGQQMFGIPQDIRPHFLYYRLEVVFWGLREHRIGCLPPTPKVMVVLECYKNKLSSNEVKAEATINFDTHAQSCQLLLPQEREYAPPLTASLYEIDFFNKLSYKGGAISPYITKFQRSPLACISSCEVLDYTVQLESISSSASNIVEIDEAPDWWTKYYAAMLHNRVVKVLKIYENELERQPEFQEFQDFLIKLNITRGKADLNESTSITKQKQVACLKCAVQLNLISESTPFTSLLGFWQNEPLDVTVRVYIIAAYDLAATDINGRCDPYIVLNLGKLKFSDRQNYVFKDCNPVFGKCYELKAKFPWDHTLKIRVMDHDICLSDNLIGQTEIDLENRFYSRHRGSCGIADSYETSGYCKWRDNLHPFEILEQMCRQLNMPKPQYADGHILMGDCSINGQGRGKDETALEILKKFDKFCEGVQLVPEHVETRMLYYPGRPGLRRGRLQMWVDIFPGHCGLPPPVDVTPRAPIHFELRVIVWNVADVPAADLNILTGDQSSDIYVKAWLNSPCEMQKTDIHYRSLSGEGNFNWRFIFPFLYSPAEHKLIILKKNAFSDGLWKEKVPCTLEMQVWDNDVLMDDFLGHLSLNLSNMPMGAKSARQCSLKMLEPDYPQCSLFKLKKCRGWWPFQKKSNKQELGGKVDMEIEILTKEQAKAMPAGLGREGPQKLDEPKRPVTNFFQTINPLIMIKRVAFGNFGKKLIYACVIAVIAVFFLSAWLALPGLLLKKWLSA